MHRLARLHMSMANTPTWQTAAILPHPCAEEVAARGNDVVATHWCVILNKASRDSDEKGRQGGRPCATGQSGSSDDIERYGKKSEVHMVGHALKRVHPPSSRGCGPTRGRTVVFVV
jgi:hypothetical protein